LISNPHIPIAVNAGEAICTKLTVTENGAQEKPSWRFWIQSNKRGKERFQKTMMIKLGKSRGRENARQRLQQRRRARDKCIEEAEVQELIYRFRS
jgi:hypothetical protein